MISVSGLLCGGVGSGDYLRYPQGGEPRPIVVWNYTRRCNLACRHCYANAGLAPRVELSTDQGKGLISDLAKFGVPVLLFSGGEPLMRPDFGELAAYAGERGLRLVVSTNGTLIGKDVAAELARLGFAEVGISLDGIGEDNDLFRGRKGAFRLALEGIRNSLDAGLRVSLRFTITRSNAHAIPAMFRLAVEEGIDRVCFYHLAYAGRGSKLREEDLDHRETRRAVEIICEQTEALYEAGFQKEVLTVDNHADGVYIYRRLLGRDYKRAQEVLSLLQRNGGNSSGIRIAAIDETGEVHPDQFWRHYSAGNVTRKPFSEIWAQPTDPLLRDLRRRRSLLKGRCGRCSYLDICNGNLRVRAEAVYGDIWAEDPACYLTDDEIGINGQ